MNCLPYGSCKKFSRIGSLVQEDKDGKVHSFNDQPAFRSDDCRRLGWRNNGLSERACGKPHIIDFNLETFCVSPSRDQLHPDYIELYKEIESRNKQ